MDQGLAAVLGALVGALATGAGAYVTAKFADRTQKKQARREVYRAFLTELISTHSHIAEIRSLLARDPVTRVTDYREYLKSAIQELATMHSSLQKLEIAVHLEGPTEVASPANEATRHVSHILAGLSWLRVAPEGEGRNDLFEAVESRYGALDDLIGKIHRAAPRFV